MSEEYKKGPHTLSVAGSNKRS